MGPGIEGSSEGGGMLTGPTSQTVMQTEHSWEMPLMSTVWLKVSTGCRVGEGRDGVISSSPYPEH